MAPKKQFNVSAVCKECSKTFSKDASLKRHVLKFHSGNKDNEFDINEIIIKKDFKCTDCNKNFPYLKNLRSHKKVHHPKKMVLEKKCPLCQYHSFETSKLISHFQRRHDLYIITQTVHFSNFDDFTRWKLNLEKSTNAKFLSKFGSKVNMRKTVSYRCHRSGIFETKGRGVHRVKDKGTCKINGYCPAKLCLNVLGNGKCEVTWTKTHVGHDSDLANLVTIMERSMKAANIPAELPFEVSLDQNKDPLSDDDSKIFIKEEPCAIVEVVSDNEEQNDSKESLEIRKNKLKLDLMKIIDELDSVEELEAVQKLVYPIQPTVIAMRQQTLQNSCFNSTASSS